jgi:hypothetical protein
MMGEIDRETLEHITEAVRELAEMDYPKVWVGKPGMTADELLSLQMINDESPEWMRVEPGEFVGIEGDNSGTGIAVPEPSDQWLDGLAIYKTGLHRYLDPYVNAELSDAVRIIYAAKRGEVPVEESWGLEFIEVDELDEDDIAVAKAFTPDGRVLVPTVPKYRYVRVEDLAPEDVDEDLLESLEFFVGEGPEVMGPYIIEDTPAAREALERRLEGEERYG